MFRRDLIKNKIYGIIFIILGALTIPIEWDATFFLFALMVYLTDGTKVVYDDMAKRAKMLAA